MTTKATWIAVLILLVTLNSLAQQRNFPLPDKNKNIPFGKKPAVPVNYDEREKKMFQILYPGAEKFKKFDNKGVSSQKFAPHLFDDPNSFLRQHLANRDPQITGVGNKTQGLGSGFHLTADINTLAESDPGNIVMYLNPVDWVYPVVNNVSYFEADDGIHGRELMKSNGTAAGTLLVKDINTGEASTLIRNMIAINGKVYFSASTDGFTYHPWVTNGTEAGTQILDNINGGWSYSPQQFISVNNSVYFIADGIYHRTAIWQTNGTAAGTSFVHDIGMLEYAEGIQQATACNGLLFFTVFTNTYGRQVWRSDGTVAGTFMVKAVNIYDYNLDVPMQLTNYNNKLYFSANDGTGRKLWVSDGTTAGTTYAPGNHDILMPTDYLRWEYTQPFPILNNILYLSGNTVADGNGLYKYNAANSDGLVLVKDLTPFPDFMVILPGETRVVGNKLYMKVISSLGGGHDELWSTLGDDASTVLVKSFAGEPDAFMLSLKNGYGTLYFVKNDQVYGGELWKSDGTAAGTVVVRDVNTGPKTSQPWYITECNQKVLFSLHETKTGAELWATNGAVANTLLVKDINTTATLSSNAGDFYKGIIATKKGVLFNAYEPATGGELHASDGNSNSNELLNDIAPGEDWSFPNSFKNRNGAYYFIGDNKVGTAIYKTDGTKSGLKKVTSDIDRGVYSVANFDIAENGRVFYTLYNHFTFSHELWTSNETVAGTFSLSNNISYNPVMITVGNLAFFSAGDGTIGYELWKSDGTITGTKLIKDINVGPDGSYPYSFISYKGILYFGAFDNTYINRLWRSDGSELGTFIIGDVQFPSTTNNENLELYTSISDNTLYFAGFSNTTFQPYLWKTNGTIAGTKMVSNDLVYPFSLSDVDGTLYFIGYDLSFNSGLWKLSSKTPSPQLVKTGLYYMQYTTNACGKLYFLSDNLIWSSDGTTAGTKPLSDPFLAGLNGISSLTGANNRLFFSAFTYRTGRELFVGNACSQSANAVTASRPAPDDMQIQQVNKVNQGIYPNPTRDILHLNFYRQNTERIRISVTDITGRTVIDQYVTSREGNNNVAVSVTSLPPGNYFIKLSGNKKQVYHFIKLD